MLEDFEFSNFIREVATGNVLVDFDARTGHNHGTKFRLKQNSYQNLYGKVKEVR